MAPGRRVGCAGADPMASSEPKKQDLERLEALKRTLRDDPRSLAFVTLAEAHNRLGQHAEAADVAQRGLLSHPDSVAGRLALAVAEAEQDHVREALEQIKRALIIDQENPKALALMGRILLKRGLAKRAVQFLSHAVKLEPKSAEYTELLRQARKMARGEAVEESVPVFDASSVPSNEDNPWSDDGEGMTQTTDGLVESEHTVFDPDALKKLQSKGAKLRKPNGLQRKLDSLPEVGDFHEEEEPTAYLDTGRPTEAPADPREEPTAFAAPNPLAEAPPGGARKAKVGGSAAEYSQMMRRAEADRARAEAEERVRQVPVDDLGAAPVMSERAPAPAPKVRSRPSIEAKPAGSGAVRPPVEAPSVRNARSQVARAPSAVDAPEPERVELVDASAAPKAPEAKAPEPEPAKAEPAEAPAKAPEKKDDGAAAKAPEPAQKKAEAPAKPAPKEASKAAEPAAEAPAAHKQVGHVATRMVDDALWALYGKSGPDADPPAADAEEAPEPAAKKKAPARAKPRGKDDAAKNRGEPKGGKDGKGPMVVRTSERFGVWTRVAGVLVAAVAAGFLGHWVALASAGPGPEVASEELKGIATDLERGGLASLLAAEDQIQVLVRSNPSLEPLLDGALAELYARRWWRFGRADKMRAQAREKLAGLEGASPTVEVLAAQTILSTSSEDRARIREKLAATLTEYPDSPKTHLVKGWSYAFDDAPERAIEAYYEAHRVHPQHRGALLAIARWHAAMGAYGTAFGFFDQLQDKYPDDVEVAIERYVLGRISGQDPRAAEAVSNLAGLVREEIPQVAKDETGRAALAFALPLLAEGKLVEGIAELEKAESAFDRSPAFKRAVGGAFLAVGEFEHAETHYEAALELGGDELAARLGLARARLGQAAGFDLDLAEEGARIAKRREAEAPPGGVAELPFGTLRFVSGRFELVELEPREDVFPEGEYASLTARLDGEALQKALDAASFVALGEREGKRGDCDAAVRLFEKANALSPSPSARFGLARCRLDREDWAAAERALKKALEAEPGYVPGWLMLARARRAQGDTIGAIEALERFEDKDPVVPDALHLLGLARLERGDWEGAVRDLEAATDHLPGDWRSLLALGEAQHKLGRTEDALESHQAALDAHPRIARGGKRGVDLTPVQMMYVGRLLAEKRPARGVPFLKESLRHEDSPLEANFYLGKALVDSRRTRREGRRALEKYVRVGPEGALREEAERLLRRR